MKNMNNVNQKVNTTSNDKTTKNYSLGKLSYLYKRILIIDTETSGLNPILDSIIEIAAIVCTTDMNGNIINTEELDDFIKLPVGKKLDGKIVQLTGITDYDLERHGNEADVIRNKLYKLLLGEEKTLIIAYNAGFDLGFIYNFLKHTNFDYILNSSNIDFIDCLTIYKDRALYPHRLKDAIEHYSLQDIVQNTHRAIDDAKATLEVLNCIAKECNDLDKYINLFGYNPKYPILNHPVRKVHFQPQPYGSNKKIYE